MPAHLDEELDVVRDAEIVAHLNSCPACAEIALAHAARRGLLREKATRFSVPADLAAQIRAALPDPVTTAKASRGADKFRRVLLWSLPLAASLTLAAFLGFQSGVRTTRSRDLVAALTSSHVRAMMSEHPFDVESTDRHTVKPWFVGKLDFAPPVIDLAAQGFPLIGGRLDELSGQRVAVLAYQRRKHVIDVYIAPVSFAAALPDTVQAGFNIRSWVSGNFRHVAISDLAADELKSFVELSQRAEP